MATIEFLLNGTPQQCHVTPETSILTLLREHLGATGTKEGCASGDCGACTVAVGGTNPHQAPMSVNACITPAHQLNGQQLITIEGLENGQSLHPAQQAMIEHHASQCGFCTPGIVMSLFTLHAEQQQRPAPLTDERLEAVLGGNLCRCTGYRPIRSAALAMEAHLWQPPAWLGNADLPLPPSLLPDKQATTFFARPDSLADLLALRQRYPNARLVAGATDLWLENTQQLILLDQLIDITSVDELRTIDADGSAGWWIGAGVTYRELEPLLTEHYPGFAHLLHRLGSRQIRNRATLGGNIANASPIGDTPPVLLALDAQLELLSQKGSRTLPLKDFFVDYKQTCLACDEIIGRIYLPALDSKQSLKVWKLSKRREDDISAVLGAFCYRLDNGVLRDVRIGFGGMAATPKRALASEAALEGQPIDKACFKAAQAALAGDFTPMSDVRGSQHYRHQAASNLFERLYLTLTESDHEVMLHAYAH